MFFGYTEHCSSYCHVYLLFAGCFGSRIQKVSLVEKIHHANSNCKGCRLVLSYYYFYLYFQIQFFLILVIYGQLLFKPTCGYPKLAVCGLIPQNLFMLILFGQFYYKSYIKPKKSAQNGIQKKGSMLFIFAKNTFFIIFQRFRRIMLRTHSHHETMRELNQVFMQF